MCCTSAWTLGTSSLEVSSGNEITKKSRLKYIIANNQRFYKRYSRSEYPADSEANPGTPITGALARLGGILNHPSCCGLAWPPYFKA